ncbi:enkurin [Nasonia vitripennis]|uniref:Enkurin domain-containing protein n=1 Tax=Nasonia vitripennis TaxID=7425 RepID=A0A7M7GC43_NASVI|nr:enkurin [Nasonia vitripennis]
MTYGYGRDYDENVAKLIVKPPEKFIKSPRYISIHRERTREELSRVKSSHKSLGPPRVPLRPPSDYLKRGSRIAPQPPRVEHVHYRPPDYPRQLPDWRSAVPRTADASAKDFRRRNVENAKRLRPKRPEPVFVDTRKGDRQRLMTSGLQPIYVYKKNFGEVPSQVKRSKSAPWSIKEKSEHRRAEYEQYVKEKLAEEKSRCRYITEDERSKLLEEMKNKWSEVMKQFQCLPFLIDTTAKIKRKASLEEKLKQLEKDIQLIENHPYIYVYDDGQYKKF